MFSGRSTATRQRDAKVDHEAESLSGLPTRELTLQREFSEFFTVVCTVELVLYHADS